MDPHDLDVFREQAIMYLVLWRFRPAVGREDEFKLAYGPFGKWARLFRREQGYLGTELLRRSDDSGEYLTLDRWDSCATYELSGPAGVASIGDWIACWKSSPRRRHFWAPSRRSLKRLARV